MQAGHQRLIVEIGVCVRAFVPVEHSHHVSHWMCPHVLKNVNFLKSTTFCFKVFFSQLISQIIQKRPKSWLRSEHSEVDNGRHVVWTDSILISQIIQKRPKSWLRSEHSEVDNGRHVVWTDSILIEPNHREKYKLVSLRGSWGLVVIGLSEGQRRRRIEGRSTS